MNEMIVAEGYEMADGIPLILGPQKETGAVVQVPLSRMTRHGYFAGATGTGKTRGIQQFAEQLSMNGVPVVIADGKGDLSGMARPAQMTEALIKRADRLEQEWVPSAVPVEFLALGGRGNGVAVRAAVQDLDYRLMARLLSLTPQQSRVLGSAYLHARRCRQEIVSLDDLEKFCRMLPDLDDTFASPSMVGRIVASLGLFAGDNPGFFSDPQFDVFDLLKVDDGWGQVSVINMAELMDSPILFTTFLMWLLIQLNAVLPEVGDQDRPKLVFFFDEASSMFRDASKEFLQVVEQAVKRIRSKGVGIFFISQAASDIPPAIMAQCGNRVQFALRANTWDEQVALVKTAKTFPFIGGKDAKNTANVIKTLGIGEALVTFIDDIGIPTPPTVTCFYTPRSDMSPMDEDEITEYLENSDLAVKYARMELEAEFNKPLPVVLREDEPEDARPVQKVTVATTKVFGRVRDAVERATGHNDPWATGADRREHDAALEALAAYRVRPVGRPRYKRNPDGSFYRDGNGNRVQER
jgi:uncharacterized protein